jgi:hypothetical protein
MKKIRKEEMGTRPVKLLPWQEREIKEKKWNWAFSKLREEKLDYCMVYFVDFIPEETEEVFGMRFRKRNKKTPEQRIAGHIKIDYNANDLDFDNAMWQQAPLDKEVRPGNLWIIKEEEDDNA